MSAIIVYDGYHNPDGAKKWEPQRSTNVVSFTNAPDFRITQETPVYTKQEITLEILRKFEREII